MFKGSNTTKPLEADAPRMWKALHLQLAGITLPCPPAHQANLAAGTQWPWQGNGQRGRLLQVLGVLQVVEQPMDSWFP